MFWEPNSSCRFFIILIQRKSFVSSLLYLGVNRGEDQNCVCPFKLNLGIFDCICLSNWSKSAVVIFHKVSKTALLPLIVYFFAQFHFIAVSHKKRLSAFPRWDVTCNFARTDQSYGAGRQVFYPITNWFTLFLGADEDAASSRLTTRMFVIVNTPLALSSSCIYQTSTAIEDKYYTSRTQVVS